MSRQRHPVGATCTRVHAVGLQVLLEAASIAGMEAGGVARVIDDDEAYRAQVVDEVARARRDGVLSVPHFRIADRPGFSDSEADFLAIFAALVASA